MTQENNHQLTTISNQAIEQISKELGNVREDILDCPYLAEAKRVLPVQGYRSAIGSYWNAVVDDLRNKVIHRSLDLFNKEITPKKKIEKYEDFQDYITDYELIEGAFKIGVLDWEGRKMLQQARETRNLFDGHPRSSEPTFLKTLNLISDCNKYVLSKEYPPSIIDISEIIEKMGSENFSRNELAIDQAVSDLPSIYKNEFINRLYSSYEGENISSELRGNIEFTIPILWRGLSKEGKTQIGKRFDKTVLNGDSARIERGIQFINHVNGMMYVSNATRRIIIKPLIAELNEKLDFWDDEHRLVLKLNNYSSFIPNELIHIYISSITRTYVGYKGYSRNSPRTAFYSDGAAPIIENMFKSFDSNSINSFVEIIKSDTVLRQRIKGKHQLQRLRTLAQILVDKNLGSNISKDFLGMLTNEDNVSEFYNQLPPVKD
jgi:hypothetical protein